MNLNPYVTVWAVLAVAVLAMAAYRRAIAARDDRTLHVAGHEELIPQQVRAARQINIVDRLGQSLTVALIVYGLFLAVIYLHDVWHRATEIQVR